jgi:hypothetical protein
MKRRTEFIDVEHRGFELDDMGHTNDSLLAAMVADETIAEAWDENQFQGMYFEEAQSAMATMWVEAKRVSLAHLNRALWLLNIPKGRPS